MLTYGFPQQLNGAWSQHRWEKSFLPLHPGLAAADATLAFGKKMQLILNWQYPCYLVSIVTLHIFFNVVITKVYVSSRKTNHILFNGLLT